MKKVLLFVSCICLILITTLLCYQFIYLPWKNELNIQENKELVKKFRACIWVGLQDRVDRRVGIIGETRGKEEEITKEVCEKCMSKVGVAPSEEAYSLYFSIRDEFKEEIKRKYLY